jgi:hypothetical protein
VPGKSTTGEGDELWDKQRVDELIALEVGRGSTLVLPIATLIETGNHIAQASQYRFERAQALVTHLRQALASTSPWAAFTQQSDLWGNENLQRLADDWPALAAHKMSIGDATIKFVADYYSLAGYEVEIITADTGLKAYEPRKPVAIPRRRYGEGP